MVATQQVQRGEEFLSTQIDEDLVDAWQRVGVIDCVCIQASLINAEPEGVRLFCRIGLLLADYKYCRGVPAVARFGLRNHTRFLIAVELLFQELFATVRKRSRLFSEGGEVSPVLISWEQISVWPKSSSSIAKTSRNERVGGLACVWYLKKCGGMIF